MTNAIMGDELPRVARSLYGLFPGLDGHDFAQNTRSGRVE